jgi:hypothetical protein
LLLGADVLQDTPQLEVLLASNAGLQEFPAAVLACAGLRQLILGSNSISSLPVEVTQLTRYDGVDCTGGAFRVIAQAACRAELTLSVLGICCL